MRRTSRGKRNWMTYCVIPFLPDIVLASVLLATALPSASEAHFEPVRQVEKVHEHGFNLNEEFPPMEKAPGITRVNASRIVSAVRQRRPVEGGHRFEDEARGVRVEVPPFGEEREMRGPTGVDVPPVGRWKVTKSTRPLSKPGMGMKNTAEWYEDQHTFAWRGSLDTNLKIRHTVPAADGTPWPLPQHYHPSENQFRLLPSKVTFASLGEPCDIMDFAIDRLKTNMFGDLDEEDQIQDDADEFGYETAWHLLDTIYHVNVTILKECAGQYPSLDMDETYDLEVRKTGIVIISREVWGALRGMETLSQLVFINSNGKYVVNKTSIHDFPRYPHRGILLDTARHFLRKEVIIENLEAMAQNRMNVLHWHIVDDQSFPFYSKTFPNVTKFGAYDPVTHVYMPSDVAEIVEEARLRGIRVIPEFDTPGHTMSWGFGQDYLLTPCYDYTQKPDGYFGPINPILKSTYQFIYHLFKEILDVFPDKYVHLGGDEVPFDCWLSNPQIMSFMRRNNLTAIEDVLSLYEKKLMDIIGLLGNDRKQGAGNIVWQEVVDNGIKVRPDSIIHVWKGDASHIERNVNAGLRVIYSSCWYLDYISYGMDWDKYYKCPHVTTHLTEYHHLRNESLFLGGEAALWTEYANDDSITPRLWPRASATAERLWSAKDVLDPLEAAPRLEAHRCRMIRRGLRVGVANGPGYCPDYRTKFRKKTQPPSGKKIWGRNENTVFSHSSSDKTFVVDVNTWYLLPILIIVCFCCLALLSLINQDSKSRVVAILTYPITSSSRRGVKNIMYLFLFFIVMWSIWTSPLWLNTLETHR